MAKCRRQHTKQYQYDSKRYIIPKEKHLDERNENKIEITRKRNVRRDSKGKNEDKKKKEI